MKTSRRRPIKVALILAVLAATLAPPALLLTLTYVQALHTTEAMLQQTVAGAVRRTNRLLDRADAAMRRFLRETDDLPYADRARLLARLVYEDPRFREAGIVDAGGNLVVTNFGAVEPPIPVAKGSDSGNPTLQVIGLVHSVLMKQRSVILALPIADGGGEVNVLVDPQVLTAYLQDIDLGPSGFVAFTMRDGRILAAAGDPPLLEDRLQADQGEPRLIREGASNHADIRIVAAVSRDWALHDWWLNVWIIGGVTFACSLLLAGLFSRISRRPSGLDHDLRLGLENGEFAVVYQPIIDLASGHPVGVEALMRWQHPDDGAVSPAVFIPLAEQTGRIDGMTAWLVGQVAEDLAPMLRRHRDLWVSLNVPLSLFVDGKITRSLQEALTRSGVSSSRILLEITERQLYEDNDGMIRATMTDLRGLDVRLCLDDFGTGGCGLSQLVELDLAYLKIDKCFVGEIGRDSRAVIILDTLFEMSRRLRLTVIGEGIERPEQADYLRAAGVGFGQGWLFASPMSAAGLDAFLAGRSRADGSGELADPGRPRRELPAE